MVVVSRNLFQPVLQYIKNATTLKIEPLHEKTNNLGFKVLISCTVTAQLI